MSRPACVADGCGVGASKDGYCATHHPDRYLWEPMPIQPLLEVVRARGGLAAVGVEPMSRLWRRFYQAKYRGKLTPVAADRMAHDLLGCHPCQVWDEWWGAFDANDGEQTARSFGTMNRDDQWFDTDRPLTERQKEPAVATAQITRVHP